MNRQRIEGLLNQTGHIVGFRRISDTVGKGWRGECLDCDYVSGVLSWPRVQEAAKEHTTKTAGTWRPAR